MLKLACSCHNSSQKGGVAVRTYLKKYRYLIISGLLVLVLVLSLATGGETYEVHSGIYFYDDDGNPLTGWQTIEENRYYLGQDGQAHVGVQLIDGQYFYFLPDGAMATGWTEGANGFYYLRSNGTLVTGWFSMEGQRYYLTLEGAVTGIREVDGATYVFDKTGRLTTGWADLGDGSKAYGDLNCHPVTGWQTVDGNRFHFGADGLLSTGWTQIDGFSYYFMEDGSPAQGKMTLDGKSTSFASNGQEVILVNPWNYLPEDYSVELTELSSEHKIASVALADLQKMLQDCENDGMQPAICSSYRTQAYQENLYQRRIDRYVEDGYSQEEATALAGRSVAIPGTSEHQLGLAVDIVDNRNWNLDESQAKMPTQKWLMENSWRYGWILRYPNEKSQITGIIYEPWHYRYVGKEVAAEIYKLDICLEEYLMMLTAGVG